MTPAQITKYQKKSIPGLIKKAQEVFNKFIRLRNSDEFGNFICISCQKLKSKDQCNAGHFISCKHNSTRFDPLNCWAQCISCNKYNHGDLINYRRNLITKIGIEQVELLELKARIPGKLDRYTLIDIIITYSQKIKELE